MFKNTKEQSNMTFNRLYVLGQMFVCDVFCDFKLLVVNLEASFREGTYFISGIEILFQKRKRCKCKD